MIGAPANTTDTSSRVLLFAHWDINGLIDDHVIYSLKRYRPWFTHVVFVTTNYQRRCRRLEDLCDKVIVRKNAGFDLLSWKVGLKSLGTVEYDEVVFTNDSIYGPMQPLDRLFGRQPLVAGDIWGITISQEHQRHLQSYFFAMKRRVLASEPGREMWEHIAPTKRQRDLVEAYELPMLRNFEEAGFTVTAVFDGADALSLPLSETMVNVLRWPPRLGEVRRYLRCLRHWPYNPTHLQWRQCMEAGVPFLKVDLFRDNPNHIRLGRIRRWIQRNTDYPLGLIEQHLARLRRQM